MRKGVTPCEEGLDGRVGELRDMPHKDTFMVGALGTRGVHAKLFGQLLARAYAGEDDGDVLPRASPPLAKVAACRISPTASEGVMK